MHPLIDCHVHTERCGHAAGNAAEYVVAARGAGLEAIVFTEHLPLPEGYDPGGSLAVPAAELPDYCGEIEMLASLSTAPEVVLGVEVDWIPEKQDWTFEQLQRARDLGVEVVLGSVHFLDGWAFDDPAELTAWESRDVAEVWRRYAEVWCEAASSGLFDVLAHPDLPKKFGHRPPFDAADLWSRMADAASSGDALVEVSTGGLRKPIGELYPGHELLVAFRRAGVEATIGSDAHDPSEVGFGLSAACDALREAGFGRFALPLAGGERRWYEL